MKSFAILRTNVGLTTNMKIMVESNYELSLDSIDSNQKLADTKFKKVKFTKRNYFDELPAYFFKNLPSELAYQIKYDDDNSSMIDNYQSQYDEIYQYGARNIIDNKNYIEEYEYFAPLYINPISMPKKFIIFRVDGPGIDLLTKVNFKLNILKNFKTVKIFDLEKTSPLGEWLELNFKNNIYFPHTPLEMDFRNLEFCRWNGIDFEKGGYTTKSLFIDDVLDEEKEIYELEKFIFDNYKNNKLVFPNILNLSFLFDDNPSTSEIEKKWSLNRYFGFYLDDMELVKTISPYTTPFLKNDVEVLTGNVLYSPTSEDPFIEGFYTNRPFYVEYKGNYYLVEKFAESAGITLQQNNNNGAVTEEFNQEYHFKYRIISDVDLKDKQSDLNKNYGVIDENNILLDYNSQKITIDDFDSSDVWLIEINGIYHNLIKTDDGSIKLITDYKFSFSENEYKYKVAGNQTTINFVVDFKNPPKKFNIYKLKFTDIKDFDDRIVDTEYSKFEYEKEFELTKTDETKMYFHNYLSNTNPKELDDFIFKDDVVNIPVSSEYTANLETFKIENGDLTALWRKNPVHCRWSYQNSISSNDVPYLLNNSLIFEDYNRTTNPFDPDPKRIERNLDYFYTINSSTSSYIHHSLHVEKSVNGDIDRNFNFELDKYLNLATYSVGTSSATYSFDYFTAFFERKSEFNLGSIKKNVKKYSQFNKGDNSIPNITVFRGIEFRLFDVDSINLNSSSEIEKINLSTSNQFEEYKFSILLSENKENFTETKCFPLDIQQKLITTNCLSAPSNNKTELSKSKSEKTKKEEFKKPNCLLVWDNTQGHYASESIGLSSYVGWYVSIDPPYKVVSATVSTNYVYLVIVDEDNNIVPDLDLCQACFYKLENRINFPSEYLSTLQPGFTLDITSDCFTGSYAIYDSSNPNWNFDNSVAIEDNPETAPIYWTLTSTLSSIEYISQKSNTFYNGKYYYTLYSNTEEIAYALWDSTDDKWKLWLDFIGGTPSNQLAYSNSATEYPIDGFWTDVSTVTIPSFDVPGGYNYSSMFKQKTLSATCSGTVCHIDNYTNNDMKWEIIEQWQMDKEYATSSVVIHEDILYIANSHIDEVTSQKPVVELNFKKIKSAPYNISNWDYYTPSNNVFWSPSIANAIIGVTYSSGSFIYSHGEYYYFNNETGEDFWNPEVAKSTSGYANGDVVLFKGNWYMSMTSSNNYSPDYITPWYNTLNNIKFFNKFWEKTDEPTNPKWKPIEMWNPSTTYQLISPKFVAHEGIIFTSDKSSTYPLTIDAGQIPGISPNWKRVYSLQPDTNYVYPNDTNFGYPNPIIEMNNRYYQCISNYRKSTLENGINIYINKRWKNVLVNIAINDNTLPNLKNTERDLIYNEIYSKLTAYNFLHAVNDLSNKFGFTDYIKYTIIDESGNISTYSYDQNIVKLPYLLKCETPDELRVKIESLDKKIVDTPKELKQTKVLVNANIKDMTQLNWYNKVPMAYSIKENNFPPKVFENLHGNKNYQVDVIYRYTGYYMPLFYELQIFKKDFEWSLPGNYIFDNSLTEFGMMKERKLRKVNEKGSILKLRDLKDYKSLYPMIDEFGYTWSDFFIFRSTWDNQYHLQTVENKDNLISNLENTSNNNIVFTTPLNEIGQPTQLVENQKFNL